MYFTIYYRYEKEPEEDIGLPRTHSDDRYHRLFVYIRENSVAPRFTSQFACASVYCRNGVVVLFLRDFQAEEAGNRAQACSLIAGVVAFLSYIALHDANRRVAVYNRIRSGNPVGDGADFHCDFRITFPEREKFALAKDECRFVGCRRALYPV